MYELHVGSIHTLKLMLHPWKHAFMLYLYVSTQSTLKQKLMPYSKILLMTTGECDCWNLTQDINYSETGKWFFWHSTLYVISQNELQVKI